MSKNSVSDWDVSPANNTDIAGTNINVGCPPSDVGIFMRTIMAQIATWITAAGGPLLRSGGAMTGAITNMAATSTVLDSNGTAQLIGTRSIAFISKTAAYTLALTDVGGAIATNAAVAVPLNSAVAFVPLNTTIVIYNNSASGIVISQTAGVTLRLAGSATTGNRTLGQRGLATLNKIGTDEWVCSGAGVS